MKNILIRLSVVAVLATGSALVLNPESAEALPGYRSTFLGRLSTGDNANYYRAQKKLQLPTPPSDRNALCIWKFGKPSTGWIEGKAVSWWGSANWDTNCYRVEWKWW